MKFSYKKDAKQEESCYPYFGLYEALGLLVLFTAHNTGIVIASGSSAWSAGSATDAWCESDCEPFYGTITIAKD